MARTASTSFGVGAAAYRASLVTRSGAWTIAGWFRAGNLSSSSHGIVAIYEYVDDVDEVKADAVKWSGWTTRVQGQFYDGGSYFTTENYSGLTSGWHYLAMVYDGAGNLLVYRMAEGGSMSLVRNTTIPAWTTANRLRLGDDTWVDLVDHMQHWRVWSAALSQTELEDEAAYDSAQRTSGLEAAWALVGADLSDDSGAGRDLTSVGTPTSGVDGPDLASSGGSSSGVLSSAGASAVSFAGASDVAGALASAGVAAATFTSGALVAGAMSADGASTVAFTGGTAVSGELSCDGVAAAVFAGASTASGALSAAGSATVEFQSAGGNSGALTAAGAASVAFAGAAGASAELSSGGAATTALVGASMAHGELSSDGASVVALNGRAAALGTLLAAAASVALFTGASTASGAMAAAGGSTVVWASAQPNVFSAAGSAAVQWYSAAPALGRGIVSAEVVCVGADAEILADMCAAAEVIA